MKRDLELIRKVLAHVEERNPEGAETLERGHIKIPDYADTMVWQHVSLLVDAGFLVDRSYIYYSNPQFGDKFKVLTGRGIWLTWKGYEFLADTREERVWNAVKQGAKTAGSASVEFVWDLAKGYLKQKAIEHGILLPA